MATKKKTPAKKPTTKAATKKATPAEDTPDVQPTTTDEVTPIEDTEVIMVKRTSLSQVEQGVREEVKRMAKHGYELTTHSHHAGTMGGHRTCSAMLTFKKGK